MNSNLLEYASKIDELLEVSKIVDDEYISESLDDIVKLAVRRDVSDAVARQLIVKLQAISATAAIRATYYSHVKKGRAGSEEYTKKQFFYTLSSELDKIVAALKYIVRGQ